MGIHPTDFYNQLVSHNVKFFTGVPDSILKEFCLCIDDSIASDKHIITVNEGNAIALAAGYYLAEKSLPLVYMQNSGLGNAVNPLLSLCDPDVYSIPMLVMIGWRGEEGEKDEPQHVKQGKVQLKFLDALEIPYVIISKHEDKYDVIIKSAIKKAMMGERPVVILVKKGTFDKYIKEKEILKDQRMFREKALGIILNNLEKDSIVISTTGKTSREIFEIRERTNQTHQQDFLTVGSMGHCSSIALGIALAKPDRKVVCIDGDGSILMHLGVLATIANLKPKNFRHILLNNGVHESVGGQETAAGNLKFTKIISAIGSSKVFMAETAVELKEKIEIFSSCTGPTFLEVKIQPGSRKDLGRPTINPIENKNVFMRFLKK